MDNSAKQDLITAKAKHYLFKSKMRAYLDGSTEVPENILADHTVCGLGKWITDTGRKKYSSYTEIGELDLIHKRIHETAKVIIDLKKQGFQQKAEEKMAEINSIGNEIIDKIDALSVILKN